jgi:hypothetical protein
VVRWKQPRWSGLIGCVNIEAEEVIRKYRSELSRKGGQARAKALTAKERQKIALKASKAAAKARQKKARERQRVLR